MKPQKFLVLESCSTVTVALTEGDVIEMADKVLASDLERIGYVAKHKSGLTVAEARRSAADRRAQEKATAEAEAAKLVASETDTDPQSE